MAEVLFDTIFIKPEGLIKFIALLSTDITKIIKSFSTMLVGLLIVKKVAPDASLASVKLSNTGNVIYSPTYSGQ